MVQPAKMCNYNINRLGHQFLNNGKQNSIFGIQNSFGFANKNKYESDDDSVAEINMFNHQDFSEMNRVFEEELLEIEDHMDFENKLAQDI